MTRWDVKDDYNGLQVDLATWETRGDIKVHPPLPRDRAYSPMYLPANWFVSLVRWIQEIAVVHRRRRRSPRRPRAALRFANQHFRPTILERAARASFPDSSTLYWLLSGKQARVLRLCELTHGTLAQFNTLYFTYVLFNLNIFASNKDFTALLKFYSKQKRQYAIWYVRLIYIHVNLHNRLLMS